MLINFVSFLLFIPVFGLSSLLCIEQHRVSNIKATALWIFGCVFVMSGFLPFIVTEPENFQEVPFVINRISTFMFILVSFLVFISAIIGVFEITMCIKKFYVYLVTLECCLFVTILSTNIFIFFIAFNLAILCTVFMLSMYTQKSSLKYFLVQLISVFLILAAITYVIDISGMSDVRTISQYTFLIEQEREISALFLGAAAIQIAFVPFSTWLEKVMREAPISIAIVVSDIISKIMLFSIISIILQITPNAGKELQTTVFAISAVSMLYALFGITLQKQLRKLIAYIDIFQAAMIMVGIFSFVPTGVESALYCIGAFSLTSSSLKIFIWLLERFYKDSSTNISSIFYKTKSLAIFGNIAILSAASVPLLPCFFGEIMILFACFKVQIVISLIIGLITLFCCFFIMLIIQKIFFGEKANPMHVDNRLFYCMFPSSVAIILFSLLIFSDFPKLAIKEIDLRGLYNVSI